MTDLPLWLAPWFGVAFHAWGVAVSGLELVAFWLAIFMVIANIRVKPVAWPLAIASSLLYFLLFWRSGLFGEAGLQLFFVAMAAWGWWQWLRGVQTDGRALQVRPLGTRGRVGVVLALAAAWLVLGVLLSTATSSTLPWWDAFPTAGSVVGTWLLGRKYMENWAAWVVVNLASVGLFAVKGLWLTVLLYALFAVMSVAGWQAWRRQAASATPHG